MDTGVDYTHPALGGCFGNKKNCVVKYGYDLVGDDWDGYANPQPDDDPFDQCVGHGTHVTGIIAAQPNELNFTGVAPGATLGMYRVFSCVSWGTADDTLIAALYVPLSHNVLQFFPSRRRSGVCASELTAAKQYGVRGRQRYHHSLDWRNKWLERSALECGRQSHCCGEFSPCILSSQMRFDSQS